MFLADRSGTQHDLTVVAHPPQELTSDILKIGANNLSTLKQKKSSTSVLMGFEALDLFDFMHYTVVRRLAN